MDRKALIAITLYALTTHVLAVDQPGPSKDQSYVSGAEMTYIWKYMGVRLIETYGQGGEGPTYTGKWIHQSYQEKGGLRVVVYAATFDNVDGKRMAELAQKAFATVSRIAGAPPVRKIELYLAPAGSSYARSHRSWAIGPNHSVAYVINSLEGGYEEDVSRTVAHELFHTWVGVHQRSQMDNELGAATIENCAELDAFAYARQLDKSRVDATDTDRLAASSAAKYTLAARYAADPQLDSLFVDGIIRRDTANADALDALCKERTKRAVLDL